MLIRWVEVHFVASRFRLDSLRVPGGVPRDQAAEATPAAGSRVRKLLVDFPKKLAPADRPPILVRPGVGNRSGSGRQPPEEANQSSR